MTEKRDDAELSGKTFDQQLKATNGDIEGCNIYPNYRIRGEVVFEPLRGGVRVTARDEEHQQLWGFIGSKPTLGEDHTLVVVCGRLREILREQLKKRGLPRGEEKDPVEEAKRSLAQLEKITSKLKESVDVKRVSDATRNRARLIGRVVGDAARQIGLIVPMLKGSGDQD